MGSLNNKVAIVTGAGQGIGKGIALALAKEGASVTITEKNAELGSNTANEIKSLRAQAISLTCDVRYRDQVDSVVAATVKQFDTIDILVNNAQAMRTNVLFEDTTDEDMALAIKSGLMGTFHFMQSCCPYLKKNGGKIINLASAAGTEGHAGLASYAAAKEGIQALKRVAAHEWGKYKINVNAICPLANTPIMQEWGDANPEQYAMMLMMIPMHRLGDCESYIGRVVVFLAGPDSDYITGHTIMVDGGQTILR